MQQGESDDERNPNTLLSCSEINYKRFLRRDQALREAAFYIGPPKVLLWRRMIITMMRGSDSSSRCCLITANSTPFWSARTIQTAFGDPPTWI